MICVYIYIYIYAVYGTVVTCCCSVESSVFLSHVHLTVAPRRGSAKKGARDPPVTSPSPSLPMPYTPKGKILLSRRSLYLPWSLIAARGTTVLPGEYIASVAMGLCVWFYLCIGMLDTERVLSLSDMLLLICVIFTI